MALSSCRPSRRLRKLTANGVPADGTDTDATSDTDSAGAAAPAPDPYSNGGRVARYPWSGNTLGFDATPATGPSRS